MSLRGIRQLKSLTVQYSDIDGSSRGVREWMRKNLVKFAEINPSAIIKTEKVRNCHPLLRAFYLNGNKKQISIKNNSSDDVHEMAMFLRNQIGRRMGSTGYSKPVLSNKPSIQGMWNERMDLIDLDVKLVSK